MVGTTLAFFNQACKRGPAHCADDFNYANTGFVSVQNAPSFSMPYCLPRVASVSAEKAPAQMQSHRSKLSAKGSRIPFERLSTLIRVFRRSKELGVWNLWALPNG